MNVPPTGSCLHEPTPRVAVLVSADAEWRALTPSFLNPEPVSTPWSGAFITGLTAGGERVLFIRGGWGKSAAAAPAQYVIDRWHPELLVKLGTCGGFEGAVPCFAIIAAERTVVYDIIERMGDPAEAVAWYTTTIELGWAGADLPSALFNASSLHRRP